ncbi:hypothetical protein TanjilG_00519 [Lupinus angustifolius]|uniref:Uncharacterized protein n=1 Tax=Lupinus angustifolius TaxID=3871 RepID=A0A4P1QXA0_LUPAN|nr:PREDICTED: uncharacterized protein LOC109328364 [Lupinus angustifolius]OIV96937.1 hypothetical protein TanjilG_00519 [Lupinus angustifolius]
MGNSLAPCLCISKHGKLVRVAKPDGKVLEFSSPIHVKDILNKFHAFSVCDSKEASYPLSLDHELKAGRLYHLIPSIFSSPNITSQGNTKRIKVVITKQQLEKLVTKQISIEDILTDVQTVSDDLTNKQKPKLDPIPEENEW